MLRATHRLLRPGGRTALLTIHLPPDLSPEQRRRAVAAGPAAVATRSPGYPQLLRSAGFVDVEQHDVTASYRRTLRRWIDEARHRENDLARDELPGAFAERLAEHTVTLAAVEEGLLRRSLLVARRR